MSFSVWNELLLSVILGIVQGITEFLPISSTAHLRLISDFLVHKDIGLSASNIIQFGTLLAIIQYFWLDLKIIFGNVWQILLSKNRLQQFIKNVQIWLKKPNDSVDDQSKYDILTAQIIIATIPVIITALLFRNQIEILRENIANIAYFLIFGAVLITASEWIHKKTKNQPKTQNMRFWEVLLIGIFQSLAVLPGVSRSGATLAGALFLGRNRQDSVRFSFLLSIPALGLAGIYDFIQTLKSLSNNQITLLPSQSTWLESTIQPSLVSIGLSFILAYFVGLICLKWLLKYLAKNDSRMFIIYRIVLAVVILIC